MPNTGGLNSEKMIQPSDVAEACLFILQVRGPLPFPFVLWFPLARSCVSSPSVVFAAMSSLTRCCLQSPPTSCPTEITLRPQRTPYVSPNVSAEERASTVVAAMREAAVKGVPSSPLTK